MDRQKLSQDLDNMEYGQWMNTIQIIYIVYVGSKTALASPEYSRYSLTAEIGIMAIIPSPSFTRSSTAITYMVHVLTNRNWYF